MQLVVEDPTCTGAFVVLDNSTETPETDTVVVLLVLWIILKLVLDYRNGKHTSDIYRCPPGSSGKKTYLARREGNELLDPLLGLDVLRPGRFVDRVWDMCECCICHTMEMAFTVMREGVTEGVVGVATEPDRAANVPGVLATIDWCMVRTLFAFGDDTIVPSLTSPSISVRTRRGGHFM